MQQIKDFLNFLDVIVGTFWGFTIMEIIPLFFSGQVTNTLLSSASGFVNLLLAIAGLVYLIIRTWHFYRMSILHIAYRREEIIEKKNLNKNKLDETK
jgi:hypothetical protein